MRILLVIIALTLVNRQKTYHIYSPDREQCITFIEDDYIRYVIDGYTLSVPDTNFVRLDNSNADEYGDEVAGCWKNDAYEWKIIIDGAKVIENKLDTTKFIFSHKLPLDEDNIPSVKDFHVDGCYHFDTYYLSLVPKGAGIIE